jgi:uncharacterized protein CbrC (UPF0167 family)
MQSTPTNFLGNNFHSNLICRYQENWKKNCGSIACFYSSYQFRNKIGRKDNFDKCLSYKTFLRYPAYQFTRLLPFYVDDGKVLSELHSWIFECKETEILFIEDNPVSLLLY